MRFSQRTVNETYRQNRDAGENDGSAREKTEVELLKIYGESPTETELDDAQFHYDEAHPQEG